ncbi:MAG: isoprenylcysteine carboxylmethyltransferase family protein [Candidatus Heimdallarchaeota archaeon]|nr:MAG: isoprenylcysteine carboxylmethyltransferase family protein [Candidatus Heimdallarchaeota archaeon]
MFDYQVIGIFFAINLTIYLVVTLPLDIVTYLRNSESGKERSHQIETNFTMIITFLTTGYLWVLYFVVPITALLNRQIFLYQPLSPFDILNTLIQSLGLVIVLFGTFVASWGRISRGKRAFSWGVPKKLEKEGMYKYIRHPLYASYCYYFLGFAMILQNVLILPLLIGIYGYYDLSKYEEGILVDHFGEEYNDYKKRVGRFFPRLRRE